jgi:hypothetical protein
VCTCGSDATQLLASLVHSLTHSALPSCVTATQWHMCACTLVEMKQTKWRSLADPYLAPSPSGIWGLKASTRQQLVGTTPPSGYQSPLTTGAPTRRWEHRTLAVYTGCVFLLALSYYPEHACVPLRTTSASRHRRARADATPIPPTRPISNHSL